MLAEAAKRKGKSAPKKASQSVDPNTGQPIEVTKPQKAMTGNPANPIIVYPSTGGQPAVGDPRNPMRNSTTALLQSDTQHSGRVLSEYIDYALGKIVDPTIPAQGDRDTDNQHDNQTGNVGMDNTGSDKDTAPGGPAEMGDANQRVRRRAGKRNEYHDGMPGVWGGDDADYAEETEDRFDSLFEDENFVLVEGFNYEPAPKHIGPAGAKWVNVETLKSAKSARVRAQVMKTDGTVNSSHGPLNYKAGSAVLTGKDGSKWTVRGDIFKDTYRRHFDGSYSKKPGVKMHGYIAPADGEVDTLEGKTPVRKGDLVLRGTKGEWWAQDAEKAKTKYKIEPVR